MCKANFRIMWGRPGINYVPPTFDNPVFSGMFGIDLSLLLNELVPDNFRHFDSPLLYRRFDEYGKFTIRTNHIKTIFSFERLDINFSFSLQWNVSNFISRPHITLTYDNTTYPAFGKQPTRYWLDLGCYLWDAIYAGFIWGDDFKDFQEINAEIRWIKRF